MRRELGRLLGMKARITNEHLAACGLQVRNQRGEWELTDAGRRWARSSALLPPGAQRLSDRLEPRRYCLDAGAGLMDEQTQTRTFA